VINHDIRFGAEVEAARNTGAPVVALESTIISHGLPRPANLTVAKEIEATVRAAGAVPATIGMIAGEIVVGLSEDEIRHLAGSDEHQAAKQTREQQGSSPWIEGRERREGRAPARTKGNDHEHDEPDQKGCGTDFTGALGPRTRQLTQTQP